MQKSYSYHGFYTLSTMSKLLEAKISIPFTIIFHKTLYSYNNLFSSSEDVFKNHKQSFIY